MLIVTKIPFLPEKDINQGVYLFHLSPQGIQFHLDGVINLQKDDPFLLKGGIGLRPGFLRLPIIGAPFLVSGIHLGLLDLLQGEDPLLSGEVHVHVIGLPLPLDTGLLCHEGGLHDVDLLHLAGGLLLHIGEDLLCAADLLHHHHVAGLLHRHLVAGLHSNPGGDHLCLYGRGLLYDISLCLQRGAGPDLL